MNDFHEFYMTDIIIFMDCNDLRILAILNTLNVLRSLSVCIDLRLLSSPPPDSSSSSLYPIRESSGIYNVIASSINENITTVPSNQFIGSLQYLFTPRAINFATSSKINVYVNT